MTPGTLPAMIVTGIVVPLAGVATGVIGLMIWMLALNGFMGQNRAVDTSLYTYVGLSVLVIVIITASGVLATRHFVDKRGWNAIGAAALAITGGSVATATLQVLALIISVVVADQLRTNR